MFTPERIRNDSRPLDVIYKGSRGIEIHDFVSIASALEWGSLTRTGKHRNDKRCLKKGARPTGEIDRTILKPT